ncbi:SurA N-terminal domain-containing protein [Shewanella colwelliana]|uniref:Periplasmic chaperone PpiD n=1 Tax=Shewanella colwelliana TaxID=23 RepID=A0A1E5IW48_SHECO|nr:SurA N-terminal domain-containing protein [Shewanella colwelliana]MDX1281254.1 SurA N-terminal domain-containing protein [Shewanella colwelliana]OEG74744.1 peptidylprolyl isomerase [Shewanella colwelliana]GIU36147.1 peptidylprolyl isomerase [Shewanella colwelliana]
MLEKIREGSQGVIAKSILVLVILSFAFTGVSSYLGSSSEPTAATVNGEEISKAALEQAYQSERARLEQQLGEMYDALAGNDTYLASVKQSVLERLIADKLVDQSAANLGLTVSDEQIKNAIMNEPAFQTDGRFDNDRYLALIRQLGYQANSFRDMMRADMTRRQLVVSLVGSEFVLPGEANYLADIQGQTRDIRYHIVDATPLLEQVTVSDEEANTYYQANQIQFVRPETVSLDYVELNSADMASAIVVSDEEAQTYYDENKTQYLQPEKRLAGHILVNFGDDEDVAKAKADAIYAKLAAGEDFAALAKSDSDDTFSGEQGGQLDWFEQGVMDEAFDAALFSLDKGQYSAVVKTNFGYHIVKLLDVQAGSTAPFADVKDKIIAQLMQNKAVDQFYSLQQRLADVSYEVPDTLAEAAQEVGVQVKTSPEFSRDSAPAPLDSPEVIKAAFSNTVLLDGMNSDVIELGPNHVIVVRMNKHTAAGTLAFDDVKASIVQRLKQDKANEIARDNAQTMMTALKAGDTSVALTEQTKLTRFDQAIDTSIVNKAFQMAHPDVDLVVDTAALANGYAVIVLDKVNAAESVDENLVNALKQRLSSQYSENDYRSLIALLKSKGEVVYTPADE